MRVKRANLIVDKRYAELIGHIVALWNYAEDLIFTLSADYVNDDTVSRGLFGLLGNRDRVDFLVHVAKERERNGELLKRIEAYVKYFGICLENRNIIVHSTVRFKTPRVWTHLEKPSKTRIGQTVRYPYDLNALRGALNDLSATVKFGAQIDRWRLIMQHRAYQKALGKELRPLPGPLPEIPPQPRKLNPLPPQDSASAPPPPPASRG